jgi:hypothetical protein
MSIGVLNLQKVHIANVRNVGSDLPNADLAVNAGLAHEHVFE